MTILRNTNTPSDPSLSKKQSAFILTGILLGILLEALDTTVVNTALRTILTELGGQKTMLGWVVGAYLLMITVTTPIYGRLSDLYGRMPFYLGGMALFMLGSTLSGFSRTVPQLIGFRALQGLGAGAMMPLSIALIQTVFPKNKQGKIQGMMPLAFGVAIMFGPTLGGFITDHLGWRWLFFLNLPFGLLAIMLLYKYLPLHARQQSERPSTTLDSVSVVLLLLSSSSLVLGFLFVEILHLPWASWRTLLMFAGAILLTGLFVVRNQKQPTPLIPMALFRNFSFSLSIVGAFLTSGILLWNIAIYIPVFMQTVLKVSPTQSGLTITPMMVGMLVGSFTCGRLFGRAIKQPKILALISSVFVLTGMGFLTMLTLQSTKASVIVYTILTGVGIGMSMPLYGLLAANSVEKRNIGLSFGLLAFFRNFGGAFSTAFFGSIFGLALFQSQKLHAASMIPQGFSGTADKTLEVLFTFQAVHQVFLIGLGIAVLAFFINLCLPRKRIDLTQPNQNP